jgi:RNA polymerase sigma-70 factor (ECF subfamily)
MDDNSANAARLLEQARAGDHAALNELFAQHRTRLRRMVQLRLDRRLQARIDASDVIQEAYLEAVNRLDEYLRAAPNGCWGCKKPSTPSTRSTARSYRYAISRR